MFGFTAILVFLAAAAFAWAISRLSRDKRWQFGLGRFVSVAQLFNFGMVVINSTRRAGKVHIGEAAMIGYGELATANYVHPNQNLHRVTHHSHGCPHRCEVDLSWYSEADQENLGVDLTANRAGSCEPDWLKSQPVYNVFSDYRIGSSGVPDGTKLLNWRMVPGITRGTDLYLHLEDTRNARKLDP
jgi:hypothetical protein